MYLPSLYFLDRELDNSANLADGNVHNILVRRLDLLSLFYYIKKGFGNDSDEAKP